MGTDVEEPGLGMLTGQPLLMVALGRLLATTSLHQTRAVVCDAACAVSHADGALLFERDAERDTLDLTCTRGPRDSAIDTYAVSRQLALRAHVAGRAKSTRDTFTDPELDWLASGWREAGRLCLAYPLRAQGDVDGAIVLVCLGRDRLEQSETWALRRFYEPATERLRDMRTSDAMRADALTDPLTEIANRRGLEAALAATGEGFGLVMVDFDDLKKLNEHAGYHAGDAVLAAIGAGLREEERPGETAVRLGGDEFVLLIPDATLPELEHRAAALATRLELLDVPAKARDLYHGASVGVAIAAPGEQSSAVLERASEQMKSQKRRRKSDRPA